MLRDMRELSKSLQKDLRAPTESLSKVFHVFLPVAVLDFSDNSLKGALPKEIANIKMLGTYSCRFWLLGQMLCSPICPFAMIQRA